MVSSSTFGEAVARTLFAAMEPFALWGLFCPELSQAIEGVGLGGRAGYLVARAAPLGQADPAVVVSAFRSLPATSVRAVIPAAWDAVSPAEAVALTHDALSAACARAFSSEPFFGSAREAVALLDPVISDLDMSGRPLAAGGQAVVWPDEPWARLWRHLTTLREYRGDGHIASLTMAGLDLVESEVLMSAWAEHRIDTPRLRESRQISETAWDAATARLRDRGLVASKAGAALTAAGHRLRDEIESATDRAAFEPWKRLGPDYTRLVREVAELASAALITGHEMQPVTPVGAPWPPSG